ncbi:MAG: flagellar motor switch protein FliG [Thermodesulfobacteriota bacterium]
MASEKLAGPQKAAILLFSLGEELAASIVKQLREEEIRKLGNSISKVFSVTPKMVETVLSEHNELASAQLPLSISGSGGAQFLKSVVSKAIQGEKAKTILEGIQEEGRWNLFQKIRQLDPKTIASFIRNEHPQTIAIILTHLDTGQAASILKELPEPLQADVVYRIAELENVPHGIVEEIDQALEAELVAIPRSESQLQGGVRMVAEILNRMDSTHERAILKGIEEQKQELAEAIRKLMFVFEDLIQVDDKSIMAILKEVNNEMLMTAMKTASDELKEKIFKNMSERAAEMMKEDLEVMGPVRLKDVEAAQQSILEIAKKLESEGKIVLMGRGKEEVFV